MTLESALRGLLGGGLIGLASALALGLHGQVAGISGILGHALDADPVGAPDRERPFRLYFLLGLVGAGLVLARIWPSALGAPIASLGVLVVAGVLVGVGTTLSNGCTSGHGVCGLGRGSPRSLAAVMTFMGVAIITVFIVGRFA